MKSLDERDKALENRVEELAAQSNHAASVSVMASDSALEAKKAYHQNVVLMNALSSTQAEQGRILRHHTEILGEHTRKLEEHSHILGEHSQRFDAIDKRFDGVDKQLEAIRSMLSRMTGDDGDAN